MKHLYVVYKKYRVLVLVYLVMGLTQAYLQSFNSSYFKRLIDNFTNNTLTISNIVVYGAAMLLLYIVSYLDEYPGRRLEHGIGLNLKTDALRKIIR